VHAGGDGGVCEHEVTARSAVGAAGALTKGWAHRHWTVASQA
jgi:hypothetical protein